MSVRKVVSFDQAQWHLEATPDWVLPREPDWEFGTEDDAPVVFLLLDEQHLAASRAEHHRWVRRLSSPAAVQSLSQVELEFDPAAHRLLIHEVAIWRRNAAGQWEKRASPERDAFFLRQREQQMEQQILRGHLSVVTLLEDVRVGDVIDLSWTLDPIDRLPGLRYTAFFAFAWLAPVARVYFTLHHDHAEPVHVRMHLPPSGPPPLEEKAENHTTWHVEKPAPLKPEPNTPASYWPFAMLDLSAWSTWQEVAQFVGGAWAEALDHQAEAIRTEAETLLQASGGDAAAAAWAAIRMVREEIRYLAVDFGHGGGILPNAGATALRRRFGDCKDKSVLLVALLRALGHEAWPVLVAPRWREAVARVQPSPSAFSHAIVALKLNDRLVYLDPTLRSQAGDAEHVVSPPYERGLLIAPETTDLVTLPPSPPAELTVTEVFQLDRNMRDGRVRQKIQATSWMADELRAALLDQGRKPFQEGRETALRQHFPGLVAKPDPAQVEDDPAANTIRWQVDYGLPTWGPAGKTPPLRFDYGAHALSLALEMVHGPDRRTQPWALRFPMTVHHSVIVEGKCVQPSQKDENYRFQGPGFHYSCEVRPGSRKMTFDYRWSTKKKEIAPAEWTEYKEVRAQALRKAGAHVGTGRTGMISMPTGEQRKVFIPVGFIVWLFIMAITAMNHTSPPPVPQFDPNWAAATPRARTISYFSEEKQLETAKTAVAHGDYRKALKILSDLAPTMGNREEFQLVQVQAMLLAGDYKGAGPLIEKVRRRGWNRDFTLLEARRQEELGNFKTGLGLYKEVLDHNPDDAQGLEKLGALAQRGSDPAAAIAAWEKLLALHPNNVEIREKEALLLWQREEREHADALLLDYANAQVIPSTSVQSAVARYYAATGRIPGAVDHARQAAKLDPDDAEASLLRTTLLLKAGQTEEALLGARADAQRLHKAANWHGLALAAIATGNHEDAEKAFRQWLDLAPWDPAAHAEHGMYLLQTGAKEDAKRELAQASKDFPKSAIVWESYGTVLEALGDPEAGAAKEKAKELAPPGK